MANSKELMLSNSVGSPEFIQDLLPAAKRTALLYNLSYLCLGGFPKLERLIRERALETQMLFGSSEAVLLKCVGTSDNLVTCLFPMLMKAIEKKKPVLAVKYLEKAKGWIQGIIEDVDDMVARYDQQNRSVASCTSDVFQEQKETEVKREKYSEEMKCLQEAVAKCDEDLKKNTESIKEIEQVMDGKDCELQNHIKKVLQNSRGMTILAVLVPFVGPLVKSIYDTATEPGDVAKTHSLQADLSRLSTEKISLQNKEWKIQIKQTDLQLQLASCKMELGVIPDPDQLKEVQKCLSQIQQILRQLKTFWEKVASLLDTLKERTFVDEDLVDDLEDMKEEFLESIITAKKYWKIFGCSCQRVQAIFMIQSKDAYKFLEINPSSLSPQERAKKSNSIMEELNKISPQCSSTAAITE
ncbi:uncharacterized protein [Danio rerio]|uniref:Uncharacterized protein n=1 Tax=Danio rerio TaxID=7955 RepID=A0AC58ISX3_DANRE